MTEYRIHITEYYIRGPLWEKFYRHDVDRLQIQNKLDFVTRQNRWTYFKFCTQVVHASVLV